MTDLFAAPQRFVPDAPPVVDAEGEVLLAALRRARLGSTVLELARATELGAVVVVPAIRLLVEAGLVQRKIVGSAGHPASSAYLLTSSARRRAG